MQRIAEQMSPPRALAQSLRDCSVHLAWGRDDPWYPMVVARMVRRGCRGQIHSLNAGHFAPWEDPEGFVEVLKCAAEQV